jgi:hypothetical protein
MTNEEFNTIYMADSILMANPAHMKIEKEQYPECLCELCEVCIDHLEPIRAEGIGRRIVELEILKRELQKRILLQQIELL